MDVILDTNRYVADFKMTGAQFQGLFDYLRRTDSAIFVPRVVRDEVLGEYKKQFDKAYKSADDAIRNLRRHSFVLDVPERLSPPDLHAEVLQLERELSNPSPGVRALVADDYSEINVEEVARRGIHRIKPASEQGEELRDVMLWLAAMSYAKKRVQGIAFISGDSAFGAGANEFHQELKDELAAEKVDIAFFHDIGDFLKTHSPAPKKAVSAQWVAEQLNTDAVKKLFNFHSARSLPFPLVVLSATDPVLHFRQGSLYELSTESGYAELDFEGVSTLLISQPGNRIDFPVSPYPGPSAAVSAGQVPAFPVEGTGLNTADLMTRFPGTVEPVSVAPWHRVNPSLAAFLASPALASASVEFSAEFTVSLRIEKEKITKLEVYPNHFRPTKEVARAE